MTRSPFRPLPLLLIALAGCRPTPPLALAAAETLAPADASDPTVAIDPRDGTVYVAWAAMQPDSAWNAMLAVRHGTGAFGAPVRVNRGAGEVVASGQFPPQVQVGTDGAVHVAWLASDSAGVQIRVSRSDDGGVTFQAPVTVGVSPSLYFDMATGPAHAVYIAWLDLGRYARDEERRASGAETGPPMPIDADLRLARSTDDGRTFTTLDVLDTNACICCRTAVAGAAGGEALLGWRHVFPVNERDMVVARIAATGPVLPPVRVHEDRWVLDGCPDMGPDLGLGSDGSVHAAWYTAATGRQGLYYARSTDRGRSFGAPVALRAGEHVTPSQVKVALAGGVPWLVWEEGDTVETRLRLAHVTGDTTLALETEPVGRGTSPAIAAGHGVLGLAWADQGAVQVRLGTVATP